MKTFGVTLVTVLVLSLTGGSAAAEADGPQFSAEMHQRGPGSQETSGQMFVADGKVRVEMAAQGQAMVRITDEQRKVEWVLFPDQKTYLERTAGPDQGGGPAPTPAAFAENPCAGVPGLTCRKLGDEAVSGRPTAKWEITGNQDGKSVTTTQWIDKDRGIPLRQEFPDGGSMLLALQGKETIEGRGVEKWEVVVEAPGREATHTFQWYDPELKLAVRQEFPGGAVSELKNIRVGKQPDDLFVVPAGYTRVQTPKGQAQPK
jgi:hypothetical protein